MCNYDINQELTELNILMENDQLAGKLERVQKAYDYCTESGHREHLPYVYRLKGHHYERTNDYARAIEAFEIGLKLAEETHQTKIAMDLYRELGNLHSDLGHRSKALYYYFNGLEYLKEDDYSPVKEASFCNNIGTVYRDMNRYKQALPFFLDACRILENEQEKLRLCIISSNIAEAYYFLDELESSKKYNELSRSYAEDADVPSSITYSGMLQFIYTLEETDDLKAFEASYSAFIEKIYKESVLFDIIYYHYTIGKALFKMDKWDLAEKDLVKAYDLAMKNKSIAQTGNIQDMLQAIYESKGDFEKAYKIAHEAIRDLKQFFDQQVDSEYDTVKKHFHHITSATQMEHLEDSVRIFKLLSEIGEEINRNMNIEGIFRHILAKIYDIWDLDTFGLAILQDDRMTMDYYYHSLERGLRIGTRTVGDDSIMGYCLKSQKEMIISDSLNQRNYRNQLPEDYLRQILDSEVRSLIFLPLYIDGTLLGGITIQSTLREYFSAKDIEILKTLGASCATAVTNYRRHQELLHIKDIDGLTGAFNRQALIAHNENLDHDLSNISEPVLIAMCDIDYFKEYNDTYGHLHGDQCLIAITTIIQEALKPCHGKLFRYGGDEFVIIIEDMTRLKATALLETITDRVRQANIEHKMSPIEDHVTLSLGGAVIQSFDLESLVYFDAVDAALYAVKAQGRNGFKLVDC